MKYAFFFGVLCFVLFAMDEYFDTYTQYNVQECKITDKYHGYSFNSEFILIFDDPKGRMSTTPVSDEIYDKVNIGQLMYLNLRECDIRTNHLKSLVFVYGKFLLFCASLVLLTLGRDIKTQQFPWPKKKQNGSFPVSTKLLIQMRNDAVFAQDFVSAAKYRDELKRREKNKRKNIFGK